MAGTPAEFAESLRRLIATGSRSLPDQMILPRGLRFGKKEILEAAVASMTMEEVLKDSPVYQWLIEKGERIGMQHTLTQLLTTRFGQLPGCAEERLTSADASSLNRCTINFVSAASLEDCLK